METTKVHWGHIGITEKKWKLLFRVQDSGLRAKGVGFRV